MRSTRTIQIILVLLVAGLIAFVFFKGKNNSTALVNDTPHANAQSQASDGNGFDFALLEKDILAKLNKNDAAEIMLMKGKLNGRGKMQDNYRQLGEKYEKLNQPAMAGYYFQKWAELQPDNEQAWANTGRSFFEAQGTVTDTLSYSYFVTLSFDAFSKALALNPGNLEAKTDQAVNIIEGRKGMPMEGIGMLRSVVQVDPDNRKALYYLGILSMQSGQMAKAVERFNHLIKLGEDDDPNYAYYYRSLGQAYVGLGKKDSALYAFKQYRSYVSRLADARPKQEADELIKSVQ
jgi:tetratricopeptide (TPR) repeat protein